MRIVDGRIELQAGDGYLTVAHGRGPYVTFEEDVMSGPSRAEDLLLLDDALERLRQLSERQSVVVEYRFFGGLTQEEIKVNVENSTLTIAGERRLEGEDNREGYQRIERSYGTFSRSFALPDIVDVVGIEAKMDKGVLTVTLPKREEVKPKQIEVHVA